MKSVGLKRDVPEKTSMPLPFRLTAPLLLLALSSAGFGLSLLFQDRNPLILSIQPQVANPGDEIVLEGQYLGDGGGDSSVLFTGLRAEDELIREWSPQKIVLRVPQGAQSGEVYVQTPVGKSEGYRFTLYQQIPKAATISADGADSVLLSSTPFPAFAGQALVVKGRNFGSFQGDRELVLGARVLPRGEVLSWSDQQLSLILPYFAENAGLRIQSPRGSSNELQIKKTAVTSYYEILGTETLLRLTLRYEIGDVELRNKDGVGSVSAFMPRPVDYGFQERISERFTGDAAVRTYPEGVSRLTLRAPTGDKTYVLGGEWTIRTRKARLALKDDAVLPQDGLREALAVYGKSSDLVPIDNKQLQAFVKKYAAKDGRLPVSARQWYLAVLETLENDNQGGYSFASQVWSDKKANAFGYANLFAAGLRILGIPSRLVEGFLIDKSGNVFPHYWVDFLLAGIGWVQADPYLGDGNGPDLRPVADSRADFYFGGQDGRHVALFLGENPVTPSRIDGNTKKLFKPFLLMSAHSEASSDIDSYGLFIDEPGLKVIKEDS